MTGHDSPATARRRRRRVFLVLAAVATVVLTGAVVWLAQRDAGSGVAEASAPAPAPKTAEIRRTDLVTRERVDATITPVGEAVLTGRRAGTVTALPAPGAVIDRGQPVYSVDAVGVPLFFGTVPMYRELHEGVPEGPDVRVLQENLAALGHRPGPVDGIFGKPTEAAVRRWQREREVEQTGRVAVGEVVVAPQAQQVQSVTAALGDPATGELMTLSGVGRQVAMRLPLELRGLVSVGMKVQIELLGGRTTPGTVSAIHPPTATGRGGAQQDPDAAGEQAVPVTFGIDDPAAVGPADPTAVTIAFETARRDGVLAVPVQALLALREGSYGLEVIRDGVRDLVAVEVGVFADGLVEVTGPEIAEGMAVVTAS
jgi:peptidoglycan hydrolase-like protein with peptidoglycan-binding domain